MSKKQLYISQSENIINIPMRSNISTKFKYRVNSQGFRDCEIDKERDCLLFLGGESTVGIGVSEGERFSNIVSSHYNLGCVNLGTAPTSYSTIFRLLYTWSKEIGDRVKGVIIVTDPQDVYNLELLQENKRPEIYTKELMPSNDLFLNAWKQGKPIHFQNYKENFILSVKQICEESGVPIVIIESKGIETHKTLAKQIINELSNKNTYHHTYHSFDKIAASAFVLPDVHNKKIVAEVKLYNHNLIHNKEELLQNGWNTVESNKITYILNNEGYREGDIYQMGSNDILCCGCSCTFGDALPKEYIWPYKLEKLVGVKTWNLGVSGASVDKIFRIAYQWVNLKKPKYLCILLPPEGRTEIISNDSNKIENWFNWVIQNWSLKTNSWFVKWLLKEKNYIIRIYQTLLALQKLCNDNNTKLLYHSPIEFPLDGKLARDLMHPGEEFHTAIATTFQEEIKDID